MKIYSDSYIFNCIFTWLVVTFAFCASSSTVDSSGYGWPLFASYQSLKTSMAVGVKNLRFKLPPEKESSLQERKQLYITLYLKVPCGNFNSEKIRKRQNGTK